MQCWQLSKILQMIIFSSGWDIKIRKKRKQEENTWGFGLLVGSQLADTLGSVIIQYYCFLTFSGMVLGYNDDALQNFVAKMVVI